MIVIDFKDAKPIYEQVVDKFKVLIFKGILQVDEQMPSVRSLAMELSINPNTIQKAYMELERQGFIYSVKGRGNFVSYNDNLLNEKKNQIFQKLKELLQEAVEIGITQEEFVSYISKGANSHD